MRERRRSLSRGRHRSLSRQVGLRLEALLLALGAWKVGAYAAVRGEADLSWLWRAEAGSRWRFFFPRVAGEEMTFHSVGEPARELRAGAFGIPEPPADAPLAEPSALDVILTPGMAYDRFGGRIGSGKGYYDRLLGECTERTLFVGAGFAFQLDWRSALPLEPWDGLMDWVVTDREAVRCLPREYALGV